MPSCRISVKVTPNASADRVGPWKNDELQMRVRAPAVDGRANEALCDVLAGRLGLHSRAVCVARGTTSRHKMIDVQGMNFPTVRARLEAQ